jgi:hypothetical protein
VSLPVFVLLMGATAALVGYAIWLLFVPQSPRRDPARDQVDAMTRQVENITRTIATINAAHKAAYDAVESQPREGDAKAAFDGYVVHAPDPRLRYDFDPLTTRFEETDHPPYLAVIAGLALREMAANGGDFHLQREAVSLAFDRGTPGVVDYLAQGLANWSEGVDRWIRLTGDDRVPAATIARMEARAPHVAARLRDLADAMHSRHRQLLVDSANRIISEYEPFPELEDTYALAAELVRIGSAPYPEIAARIDSVVESRSAHPDWRVLRLDMDFLMLESRRHPDVEAVMRRIEAAFDDIDPDVLEAGSDVASVLVQQDLADPAFIRKLRDGLARARLRHDPPPEGLARLEARLDSVDGS